MSTNESAPRSAPRSGRAGERATVTRARTRTCSIRLPNSRASSASRVLLAGLVAAPAGALPTTTISQARPTLFFQVVIAWVCVCCIAATVSTQARSIRDLSLEKTGAALLFLVAYAVEVLANLQGEAQAIAETIITVTWLTFVADYVVNLILVDRRWTWFRRHLFDLAVIVLPALRPLRLLRLVTLVRALQGLAGAVFRGRIVAYVAATTVLLVFVASLAILDTERSAPGALITTFGEALWWAFVTITTVGYGDLYPVTSTGRFIAAAVMIGGIALIGVVTATLASWIVENVARRDVASQAATRREVAELADEIRKLRHELTRMDEANVRKDSEAR